MLKSVALVSLLAAALIPVSVLAESKTPTVALYPPDVLGADADELAQVRASIASELLRQGVELAPSDDVAKFVEQHPLGGCIALEEKERASCLAELAKKTGAERSLLLVISPRARNELRISAQVVSRAGAELKNVSNTWPKAPKGALLPAVTAAFHELVPSLDLKSVEIEVTPLTVTPPPPGKDGPDVVPPGPPAPQTPPSGEGAWKKTAGYVGLGAGAVLLGVGAYGFIDASSARGELGKYYDGSRPHGPAEEDDIISLRNRMARSQTLALVGVGAGAVAALAGAWFLVTAPPPETARAGDVTFLVGPGQAACRVTLP